MVCQGCRSRFCPGQGNIGWHVGQRAGKRSQYSQGGCSIKGSCGSGRSRGTLQFGCDLFAGIGGRKDEEAGYHYFLRAGEAGLPAAQLKLGLLYAQGDIVPLDLVEALKWFLAAAEAGDTAAKANVEQAIAMMDRTQVLEARRRAAALVRKIKS